MSEVASSLREEISFLKSQLEEYAQGITEQKYLQQAKKTRELSVKLDSEKARVSKLQSAIIKLEEEKQEQGEAMRKGVMLPSTAAAGGGKGGGNSNNISAAELEAAHTSQQLGELKTKLDRSASQNASLRAQVDKHDRDMMKIKKVLLSEIGDENAVDKILGLNNNNHNKEETNSNTTSSEAATSSSSSSSSSEAGYRGRAQQITLLQSKVKDLTRKLQQVQNDSTSVLSLAGGDGVTSEVGGVLPSHVSGITTMTSKTGATNVTSTSTTRDFDSIHRSGLHQQESRKLADLRQLNTTLEETKDQVQKEKQRADASQSRVHTLERQMQQLRTSLQQVIQKTQNDDELVSAYKSEMESQRNEIRKLQLKLQGAANEKMTSESVAAVSSSSSSISAAASGNSPSSKTLSNAMPTAQLQAAENSKLKRRIQELEAQCETLSKFAATVQHNNNNNNNHHSPSSSTSATSSSSASSASSSIVLGGGDNSNSNAMTVIESQRKMIIALEQKLQTAEFSSSSSHSSALAAFVNKYSGSQNGVIQALRDENASLRERITALTNMVDREIELRRAQLMMQHNNNNNNNSNNANLTNNLKNNSNNNQKSSSSSSSSSSSRTSSAGKISSSQSQQQQQQQQQRPIRGSNLGGNSMMMMNEDQQQESTTTAPKTTSVSLAPQSQSQNQSQDRRATRPTMSTSSPSGHSVSGNNFVMPLSLSERGQN